MTKNNAAAVAAAKLVSSVFQASRTVGTNVIALRDAIKAAGGDKPAIREACVLGYLAGRLGLADETAARKVLALKNRRKDTANGDGFKSPAQQAAYDATRKWFSRSLAELGFASKGKNAGNRNAKGKGKGKTAPPAPTVVAAPATLKAVTTPRASKSGDVVTFFGDMAALLDRFAKANAKVLTVDMRPHVEAIQRELAALAAIETK